MKKMICILLLTFMLIGVASAITYKINTNFDFKQNCNLDGYPCSTNGNCNFTIFYPNGSLLKDNIAMTNSNTGYFNISLNSSVIGEHPYCMSCADKGVNGTSCNDININAVGLDTTDARKDASNRGVYVLFGIAALFFFGFIFTEKFIFKWTFFMFFLMFLMIGINILSLTIYNEIGNTNIGAVFDKIGAFSMYMFWFFGGILMIMWVLTTIASIADKQRMRQAEKFGEVNIV